MRIGIVTIHHVTNYGAVFQAYALSQALKKCGAEVEIIDYRPPAAVEWYRQRIWKNGRPNVRRHLWSRTFDRFIEQRLPLGGRRFDSADDLAAASLDYDVLVAGSDQIWCTGEGSFRGFDPTFFLAFSTDPNVAKFSYAASAGNTTDFGQYEEAVRRSLLDFAAVSVRDDRTAELVEMATGRSAAVVLDPVFLHDFDELAGDVEAGGDVVIFSARPERFQELAPRIADKHGLRIVSLVNRCECADECHRVLEPVRWLRQMKGARVVLTDYFHGMAVALKFGRPFLADAAPGKTNKMADLAGRLQVTDHFLPTSQNPLEAVDCALADPRGFAARLQGGLEEPVERSRSFLQSIVSPSAVGVAS